MSAPIELDSLERQDHVPELPTALDIAAVNHRHGADSKGVSSPTKDSFGTPLARQPSGHHVDIGIFDPQGMEQLRRTMSTQSQAARHDRTVRSVSSDSTLAFDDGPFDFEKTLRHVIKRYAHAKSRFSFVS